jgi:diguanylate cyclase (GGDEF)-like protein
MLSDSDKDSVGLQETIEELSKQIVLMQGEIDSLREDQKVLSRQVARERLVDEIAQHIHRSLDLDEILYTAASEVRHFLKTDRVVIYRFKSDWNGVVTVESKRPDIAPILYTHVEEPCFRQGYVELYRGGRVRAIDDVDKEDIDDCHRLLLKDFQVKANLVVPILQNEALWGLLIAHHCREPRHWEEFDITLLRQLATQLGIAIQKSELHQQVKQLSEVDGLTQIANRRRFDVYLKDTWVRQQRLQESVSLILADIDFFKQYNDVYGHPAGDQCLTVIANMLSLSVSRSSDLVARYGGEEFVVVLPSTDIAGAVTLAENIRKNIEQIRIEHRGSPFGHVTLSLGVASMRAEPRITALSLVAKADEQLYTAKHSGRNRVC